jgi:hypothetical protein
LWFHTYDIYNSSTLRSNEDYGFDVYEEPTKGNFIVAGLTSPDPLGVGPSEWAMMMAVDANTQLPLWAHGYNLRSLGSNVTFPNIDQEVGITMDLCMDEGYVMEGNAENSWADGFYHIKTNSAGVTENGCMEELPTDVVDVNLAVSTVGGLNEVYTSDDLTYGTRDRDVTEEICLMTKPTVGSSIASDNAVVHPNVLKAGNPLQVQCNADPGSPVTLTVSDVLGRTIYSGEPTEVAAGESTSIDTRGWAAGTYFVRIVSQNYTETRSIVVE